MAGFKFRFATVLKLRVRAKEEKQGELHALLQTRRRVETEIGDLERQIRDAGETLAGREGQILAAVDLKLISDYAHLADGRRRVKLATLATIDDAIVVKRGELLEALRGVKSLEHLQDWHREQFNREQNLAEQKFADEIAQSKFFSKDGRKKNPR